NVTVYCLLRLVLCHLIFFFFFQAEDGIRDFHVTGVQTCALPISMKRSRSLPAAFQARSARLAAASASPASCKCWPCRQSLTTLLWGSSSVSPSRCGCPCGFVRPSRGLEAARSVLPLHPSGRPGLGAQQESHRSVVHQAHLHVRAKASAGHPRM